MANTYTQLYIHLAFAVEHRSRLIQPVFKDEYLKILKAFNVKYEEAYLFKWFSDINY